MHAGQNITLMSGKSHQLGAKRLIISKRFLWLLKVIKVADTLVVRIPWKSVKYLLRILVDKFSNPNKESKNIYMR